MSEWWARSLCSDQIAESDYCDNSDKIQQWVVADKEVYSSFDQADSSAS